MRAQQRIEGAGLQQRGNEHRPGGILPIGKRFGASSPGWSHDWPKEGGFKGWKVPRDFENRPKCALAFPNLCSQQLRKKPKRKKWRVGPRGRKERWGRSAIIHNCARGAKTISRGKKSDKRESEAGNWGGDAPEKKNDLSDGAPPATGWATRQRLPY